jgi:DNA-binding CsgD family transcriptional regulator
MMTKLLKLWNLNTLLYLALVLALLSSLGHVAYAFSTVNGSNWAEAYISAIAIDLGLLALAAGINKRKSERRGTWSLWGGVLLFSLISVYANWLAGIIHVTPIGVNVTGLAQWLVSLRPILLSSVLPLLVIYLSEIVSGNYQNELSEAHKQAKKVTRAGSFGQMNGANELPGEPNSDILAMANDTRKAQIDQRREQVLNLLGSGKSHTDMASELKVSPATIKRDIAALSSNGNGHTDNEVTR